MGYTTWFEGGLTPNKPFKKEFVNYINAFSKKRHEPRDVEIIKRSDPDWAKHCLDGNLGHAECIMLEVLMRKLLTVVLLKVTPAQDIGAIGALMKKLELLNGMIQKNFTITLNGSSF